MNNQLLIKKKLQAKFENIQIKSNGSPIMEAYSFFLNPVICLTSPPQFKMDRATE
ncbi:MAG: hypothetical protein RMY16_29360 [Nostoc sp. DedQUE12b]|uniref:hypothetical protein n=1 Tax=Nostoc sp. DedQUE12b TaxID=3075398 RepID=UPI002AD35B41|nr:hypothetical protein [Nostoc sp. DedQUE12b]MDZ8089629.1 hypothetical protein [Nostoc sp. DedQUE12b]